MHEKKGAPPPPKDYDANLDSLRIAASTGNGARRRLVQEVGFYDGKKGFPGHVWLANIHVGGTQGPPSLGVEVEVEVEVYDSRAEPGEEGKKVADGEAGELVAVGSFPPTSPCSCVERRIPPHPPGVEEKKGGACTSARGQGRGSTFHTKAYFGKIQETRGCRLALCVGQRRRRDRDVDENVVLFLLLMRPGVRAFDRNLVREVKERGSGGRECSKRHVPRWVFETPEIPQPNDERDERTRRRPSTSRKSSFPVKQIVSGQRVEPSGTLLNPQSLDFCYQFAEVERLVEPKEKL
ncbi:hypothetical protein MKZ38_009013 [Zalerion maritima]|uniref:Uncharacterized protein n=1 Tax=Zalerion maritima TaxID=339359 RepID=A0AAD5RKE3_9PEZI|nr:hypothetical protein MKZ38_009013 [Zalerion maritima]